MFKKSWKFLPYSVVFIWTCVFVSAQDRTKIRDTELGKLQGLVVDLGINGLPQVEAYLGVPYALPPLGSLRFIHPNNAPQWVGVRDATQQKPVCMQNFPDLSNEEAALKQMPRSRFQFLNRLKTFVTSQSEDCLYMNLYVPRVEESQLQERLPVIFLIHGESFEWNSGNPYDGSVLAAYAKLIVVTINFRLGPWGFLSTGTDDDHRSLPGNAALTDIISALEMLRSILPSLGGDMDRITLFGFGTGAAIAQFLMASPLSMAQEVPKFKRVILSSGSAFSSWSTVKNPSEYFYLLAQNLGCHTIKTHEKFSNYQVVESPGQVVECVRKHSDHNLTEAMQKIPHPNYLIPFGPVVDGIVVNHQIQRHIEEHPQYFQAYDLMVGISEIEAYNLLPEYLLQHGMRDDDREKILRTLVHNLYKYHRNEIYEVIVNQYTDWRNPNMDAGTARDLTLEALSDALYVAPLMKAAKLHAKRANPSARAKSQTFFYIWGQNELKQKSKNGDDVPFILGYPLLLGAKPLRTPYTEQQFSKTDRSVSEIMMRYIANFARTGDPNQPIDTIAKELLFPFNRIPQSYQGTNWPSFDTAQYRQQFIQIDERPRVGSFYRAGNVAFWNNLIPRLDTPGPEIPGRKDRDNSDDDERHHFLADHLNQATYFGEIYPYGGYFTTPPPPPPPEAPPSISPELRKEIDRKKLEKQGDAPSGDGTTSPTDGASTGPSVVPAEATPNWSTGLGITVAVGAAFLVLNLLVCSAVYHSYEKRKRERAKFQLQQYGAGVGVGLDHGGHGAPFEVQSPLTPHGAHMPPPPPPPVSSLTLINPTGSPSTDGDLHPSLSNMRTFHHHHQPEPPAQHNHHFAEQEPLLRNTISPMCPRHSKQAMTSTRGMEEIQV